MGHYHSRADQAFDKGNASTEHGLIERVGGQSGRETNRDPQWSLPKEVLEFEAHSIAIVVASNLENASNNENHEAARNVPKRYCQKPKKTADAQHRALHGVVAIEGSGLNTERSLLSLHILLIDGA